MAEPSRDEAVVTEKKGAKAPVSSQASVQQPQAGDSRGGKVLAMEQQAPSSRKADAQGGEVAVRADVQERVSQLRSAMVSYGNCPQAVERYREVRALDPAYRFSAKERFDVAKCLRTLGRYGEARVELYALRDDAPGRAADVNRELDAIARAEASQTQQAQQQRPATQTPSVHAAPKRAAPAKAKAAAEADAPAAY